MTAPILPPAEDRTKPRATRQKVLFIGGLGRSGSTLIEKLLNEWPQTLAIGETVHLWERGLRDAERCGCGEPFDQCPQWSAVGQLAFGGWDRVDLDEIVGLRWSVDRSRRLGHIAAAHRRGRPTADQRRYLDHLRPVLLAAAQVGGGEHGQADVLLESSKHLSTAALLALDDQLDVRILHLVRDPRGVAYSWTKEIKRPEADDDLMPTYSPARTAGRWFTDNLGFEALGHAVPTVTMRYEDFLIQPVKAMHDVAALLDIEAQDLDLDYFDGSTAHLRAAMHSVAGNPLRFGSQELRLRLDDAWKIELPRRDRRIVTGITAPLLARHRYPVWL